MVSWDAFYRNRIKQRKRQETTKEDSRRRRGRSGRGYILPYV